MMRTLRFRISLAALAGVVFLCLPGDASADDAECSVLEIKAQTGDGGVDKELKPLERKLKKPPFSSWKTFKLLKKHAHKVAQMKALNLKLVPGSSMSILYRDKSTAEGKKPRLRMSFTLDDKDGKRKVDATIKVDSGDYYLIGGDPLDDGGTYILAISCAAK